MSIDDGWSVPYTLGEVFRLPSDGKFYWYDEAYNLHGPYDTREEAEQAEDWYCKTHLGLA